MLSRMAGLLYRIATLPCLSLRLSTELLLAEVVKLQWHVITVSFHRQAKAGFIQGTLAITTGWGGATLLFEKDGKHDRVFRLLSEAKYIQLKQMLEVGWATEIYEGNAEEGLQQFPFENVCAFILGPSSL